MSKIERHNVRTLTASKDYLGAADLIADDGSFRDADVVIDDFKVGEEIVGADGRKDVVNIMSFRGAAKRWIVNKTNAKQIGKLHGQWTDAWEGKAITLYVTQCSMGRQAVDCIRVRDKVPTRKGPAAPPAEDAVLAEGLP